MPQNESTGSKTPCEPIGPQPRRPLQWTDFSELLANIRKSHDQVCNALLQNTIAFDTPEKQAYLRYCIDQQYEEAKISIIADAERQLDLYDERDRRRALAKMNGVDYNAADNNDDLSEETSESESEESDLEAEEFRQRYTKRCSTFGHVVRFSKEQRERLRAYFDKQPRPTTDQRRTLASEMGLSEHQVMRWFNNERARRKKILRDLPDGGAE